MIFFQLKRILYLNVVCLCDWYVSIYIDKHCKYVFVQLSSKIPLNMFSVTCTFYTLYGISTGPPMSFVDWPPASPDNQYHLNK